MKKNLLLAMTALILSACGTKTETTEYPELHQTVTVQGSVGKLDCDLDRPATKGKCPMVIVCHGLMDDKLKDNMRTVADSLVKNGFSTIRFSFDGHGKSEGKLTEMTVDKEVEDLKCIYRYVARLDWVDTTRIAIVAHSLGGMVSSIVAGDLGYPRVHAAVLHAPGAFLCDSAATGNLFGVKFDPKDPPETIELWGDKLGKGFIQSCQNTDVYERASHYQGPVLILQGSADSDHIITGAQKLSTFLPKATYQLLDGFTHSFEEDFSVPARMTVEFLNKN